MAEIIVIMRTFFHISLLFHVIPLLLIRLHHLIYLLLLLSYPCRNRLRHGDLTFPCSRFLFLSLFSWVRTLFQCCGAYQQFSKRSCTEHAVNGKTLRRMVTLIFGPRKGCNGWDVACICGVMEVLK